MSTPLIVISSKRAETGKTTLAFNLAAALLKDGYTVGIHSEFTEIFLQKRQELLKTNTGLKMPRQLTKEDLLSDNFGDCSVVIADVPASQNEAFIPVFSKAHTLITLVQNRQDADWRSDDSYLNLIWTAKKNQAAAGIRYLNWIVVRNMADSADEEFGQELDKQSRRLGFRSRPVLENREVYTHIKEGFSVADQLSCKTLQMSMADVYARRELLILADFMWQHK